MIVYSFNCELARLCTCMFICSGYWWALAINLVLQAIVLVIIVSKTDWEDEVCKVSVGKH